MKAQQIPLQPYRQDNSMLKNEIRINQWDSLIAILVGLLYLTTKMDSTVLSGIIVVLAAILGLLKPEALFPPFFIVSMAGNYFTSFQNVGYPRIFAIIILVSVSLKCIRKRISFKYSLLYFLIAVCTTISYLNAYVNSFSNWMTILLDIAVFFSLVNLSLSEGELSSLFRRLFYVVSFFIVVFFISLMTDPYIYHNSLKTFTSLSKELNSNTFAQMAAQMGAFCFGYYYIAKKGVQKLWSLILGFICLYCTIVSASRAGTIALILGTLAGIWIYLAANKKLTKYFFITVVLVLGGYLLFLWIIGNNPALGKTMSLQNIIESGGSGRFRSIQLEWKYIIPKHLFFGIGIGSSNEVAALTPYLPYAPYPATNIIFSMIAQVGFLGLAAFLAFFIKMLIEIITRLRTSKWLIVPLFLMLTALLNGVGEEVFYERYLWNALALGALCIMCAKRAEKERKEVINEDVHIE